MLTFNVFVCHCVALTHLEPCLQMFESKNATITKSHTHGGHEYTQDLFLELCGCPLCSNNKQQTKESQRKRNVQPVDGRQQATFIKIESTQHAQTQMDVTHEQIVQRIHNLTYYLAPCS